MKFIMLLLLIFCQQLVATLTNHEMNVFSGDWEIEVDQNLCVEKYLCTIAFRRWVPSNPKLQKLYFGSDVCTLLKSKNISTILFEGDSYMRHLFQAFVITATGNYKDGTLTPHSPSNCEYDFQFSEKMCSTTRVQDPAEICGGQLSVHHFPVTRIMHQCMPNDLIFWSEGNHPVNHDYVKRTGVNNSTLYSEYALGHPFCNAGCNSFWVSTHARLGYSAPDEYPSVVENFNIGMKHFFQSGKCGKIGYIDVYNMTKSLLLNYHDHAKVLSHDNAHWGMVVNLNKVQILLNIVAQSIFQNSTVASKRQDGANKNENKKSENKKSGFLNFLMGLFK